MEKRRTVLITGCSSGFGLLTALRFAREGWRVTATMRDLAKAGDLRERAAGSDNLTIAQLDVTHDRSVRDAFDEHMRRAGRLDALVNNAGYGYFAFIEHADMEAVRAQFETNVEGLLRVTQRAIPLMREQGGGRIINLSSLVGRFSFPLSGVYAATKHAVEAISEALAYETAAFGIRVSIVQPGLYRTNFQTSSLRGSPRTREPDSPYKPLLGKIKERRDWQNEVSGDPSEVADAVYRAATDEPPHLWYRIGVDCEHYLSKRQELNNDQWAEFMMALHRT